MTDREKAIKGLTQAGYIVIPPVPSDERIVTAAEKIEQAARDIRELCERGGRIGPLAADKIARAREDINAAWQEQGEEAA